MVRGGSWANTIDNARCAARNRNHPDNNINDNSGFRVVVVAAHVSLPLFLACAVVRTRHTLVLARVLCSSNVDRCVSERHGVCLPRRREKNSARQVWSAHSWERHMGQWLASECWQKMSDDIPMSLSRAYTEARAWPGRKTRRARPTCIWRATHPFTISILSGAHSDARSRRTRCWPKFVH